MISKNMRANDKAVIYGIMQCRLFTPELVIIYICNKYYYEGGSDKFRKTEKYQAWTECYRVKTMAIDS